MTVIGHGIDLIDLDKFGRLVDDPETDFVTRCFTEAECTGAEEDPNRTRRLAGRFAAKEAVAKALGTGMQGTPRQWRITHYLPEKNRVTVNYSGESLQVQIWFVESEVFAVCLDPSPEQACPSRRD